MVYATLAILAAVWYKHISRHAIPRITPCRRACRSLPSRLLCFPLSAAADDLDQLKVGLQADGRIVTPTNQVLRPAGRQITFPGRPVDLAFAEDGAVLVVKNLRDLVFIDLAANKVKQTLPIGKGGAGFSVVGLLVTGRPRLRQRRRRSGPRGAAAGRRQIPMRIDGVDLTAPAVGGKAHPAGMPSPARRTELWTASTRGNNVQLLDLANAQGRADRRASAWRRT